MQNEFSQTLKGGKLTHPLQWIEIHLGNLKDNLRMLRAFLGDDASIMAVVKANAYGHGLIPVSRALTELVDWFGVASLEEAIALRKDGISHPILLFGHTPVDHVKKALEWDLTLSVSDMEYGTWIDEEASRHGLKAKVHVKVDTGMGRFGFVGEDAEGKILQLAKFSNLEVEGLYTHFPQSEIKEDLFTREQIENLSQLRERLRRQGLQFKWVHASNSAAIVNYPQSHFNLVRPGLMLYGIYPDPLLHKEISLKPVLSLKAKWACIKNIKRGESVGYGRAYIAPRDTMIGILPVGYSYGYLWRLTNKGKILFGDKMYPIVGRVSMDYIAVDLGLESGAAVGETAVLIGAGLRAEDLAKDAGSIPYEIVTRLSPTIERFYIN
ncbi:MAG TPA: alanine racemase [Candidatus Omnitrophota bacterium]|nr:alanine racemase [Candidatus Omnitrophota bacterium]